MPISVPVLPVLPVRLQVRQDESLPLQFALRTEVDELAEWLTPNLKRIEITELQMTITPGAASGRFFGDRLILVRATRGKVEITEYQFVQVIFARFLSHLHEEPESKVAPSKLTHQEFVRARPTLHDYMTT